jgi:hypothetical protein
MALQLFLSNWLVCGSILVLIVGLAAMLLWRPTPPEVTEPPVWNDLDALAEKWTNHRPSYAEIRGKLQDERIWLGGPLAR